MKYKLTAQAKLLPNIDFTPRRHTKGSVGYDLSACIAEELVLLAGETVTVGTGVHIWIGSDLTFALDEEVTTSFAGVMLPRSSIQGLFLVNTCGIFDEDYQGEVLAKLYNYTEEPKTIKPGQRILQMLYIPVWLPEMKLVEDFEETTVRGEGGFGHTGTGAPEDYIHSLNYDTN